MREKMSRFLNSIKIPRIERFDLDFDFVEMSKKVERQVDMIIRKETPWEYSLLFEFQEALLSVQYPIDLKFVYTNSPSVFDAISLFSSWYSNTSRGVAPFQIKSKDKSTICFTYSNESLKEKVEKCKKEYSDFLRWINYSFAIETELVEEKPIEVNTIEQNDELTSIESSLVDKMTKEEEVYKANKERERVFRKGNYRVINSVAELEDVGLISVDFEAETFGGEIKMTKTGRTMLSIGLGDSTGAFQGKAFDNKSMTPDFLEKFEFNAKDPKSYRVRVRGVIEENSFTGKKDVMIHYLDILPDRFTRDDDEPVKRVELHLHSKMSAFDAVTDMHRYCKLAAHFGMDSIAITDHGVAQGFPEAQKAAKDSKLKMIYGTELYMFNPNPVYVFNPQPIQLKDATYCVFDFETTGLSKTYDRITEFGAVLVKNGIELKRLDLFVNPEMHIPDYIQQKTHITDAMVAGADKIDVAVQKMLDFMGDSILVSHNATFDVGFLNCALERLGRPHITNAVIDTLALSHYLFPERQYHNLGALCKNLGVTSYNQEEAHRADFDASALNDAWNAIINILTKDNENLLHSDLLNLKCENPDLYKHLKGTHCCVLAKDSEGLSSIYKLISESNITYLASVPMTPKEMINELREHLFIGSACFNGEIFDIARTGTRQQLLDAMKFYDYIEIQPLANYSFLVDTNSLSKEQLLRTLKDIVSAADELGKPICATGDVHYGDPEDKFYRDIMIDTLAIGEGRHPLNPSFRDRLEPFANPDQHLRTTREMLDAFEEWMDKDKAFEVVVTNTRKIAEQIEPLHPIIEGTTFAPNENLPNSDQKIRDLCNANFLKKYGENALPEVRERLDRELNLIIGAGYAVTYYIAHCIIKKANEDGYIVGSRGSVGSSFAATMADITEVNPLAPHYYCPECKHFEWADPSLGLKSGYDLPPKKCPVCGHELDRDGQNIPFETFLGFEGDKVPDIDLNFPSDYQSRAHDYTRVLLGANNVFRAGTIETVAQKTAYGYAIKYVEKHGLDPAKYSGDRIAYIASKLLKIKRTTGQHPGGIVVVPANNKVTDFTAIQHPADDREADWLTTHFDFNSMHDELLKLDLLGHVDPLAMRMMALETGIDIKTIPFNDARVISLFSSPKELNLRENYLKLETGTVGLPEFGTDVAQKMLAETRPKCFNDLLIISGLAHGTNVWSKNAEDLINEGVATLQEVIGCRDDIMTYLISLGIEHKKAFFIMEAIRKGKKLKPEDEVLLREHNVPDFYIKSCNKIKYLFPRAHATAYVQMAVRVGYFKVYYPLEFYSVFFSARCDDWDIFTMCQGEEATKKKYDELKGRYNSRSEPLSVKEKSLLKTLQTAIEMFERGFSFAIPDLYKSDASTFICDHEKKQLIAPFSVLDGLGDTAAQSILEARKNGEFISKKDILKRTKLSSTNLEELDRLGTLEGIPEANQLSLFDMNF